MRSKLAPLMLSVSKALARPTVEWPRVERALVKDNLTLAQLTDDRHGHLNTELWQVPIRRLKDPKVSALTVIHWLHEQGLPLSPARATELLVFTLRVALHKDRLAVAHWFLDHGAQLIEGKSYGKDLTSAGLSGTISSADLQSLMVRGLVMDSPTATPLISDLMGYQNTTNPSGVKGLHRWVHTLVAAGIPPRGDAEGITPLMVLARRLRHEETEASLTTDAPHWIGLWFTLVEAGNSPTQEAHFDHKHLPDDALGPRMTALAAVLDTPLGPALLAETRRRELSRQTPAPRVRPRNRV